MPVKSACANLPKDQCLPPGCTFVDGKTRKYCRISGKKTQKSPTPVKQPSPVRQQSPAAINPTECKLLSQDQCLPPDCQYINGKTRKYCARARKNQTSIKAKTKTKTNKNKKEITNISPLQIKVKSKTKRPGNLSAIRKIGKLVKSSSLFLNIVCKKSGACLAFGKMTSDLTNYFNGFTDFKYLSAPIIKIGGSSVNGFINEIEYERNGYKAHAILKTSREVNADNLAYEYFVGQFLNIQNKRFPCFVETYGLYYSPDKLDMSKNIKIDINKSSLIKSCEYPLSIGLMIEYLKNGYTLKDFLDELDEYEYVFFMNTHLLYILYQVYAPLSMLSDVFTHYDLHAGNVMLYPVGNGKHIQYNYHYKDRTVTFNSEYIVKMIDYGRSFFKDEGGYNPEDIYKDLCESKGRCKDCGKHRGFQTLQLDTNKYASSRVRNMSYDLMLLLNIQDYNRFNKELNKDLSKLIYSTVYEGFEGTTEITGENSNKICNVNDARRHIEKLMKKMFFKKNNDYDPDKKIGEMHIYSDGRPMEYIAV